MEQGLDQAVTRGSDQLKQGKLVDAQESFRAALQYDPGNGKVLALLGLAYFRGNEFAMARPIYEELVDRLPTDASHRLNLGLVYLKLGDADRAINALEASRALDPSQGRAVSYLGLAYARAGRYAEAYRSFLLAGQNELAIEIEQNLTPAERDGIHSQLGRTPLGPLVAPAAVAAEPAPVEPRTITPTPKAEPAIARTVTPTPRTHPPNAPPASRTKSAENVNVVSRAGSVPSTPSSPEESSAEITIIAASDDADSRLTDSMQFVLPTTVDGASPLKPADGHSMVSQAIALTSLAGTAANQPARTKAGGLAPRPLSELATEDLVRAEDGDEPFEITGGSLVIRVVDRMMTRLDGVHVAGGDLTFEPAMRRARGHQTQEKFDFGGIPLHTVEGRGYLIAVPNGRSFTAVLLDDDILYLREDLIFAFESSLRWENGNVPGLRGKVPVVQFRGDGAVAMRLERPLVRIKLPASGVLMVDADRIAGWIGRVIPRAVVPPEGGPMGTLCVECTGEGIILVEPAPDPRIQLVAKPPPPPPPEPPPPVVVSDPVLTVAAALAEAGLDPASLEEDAF